MRLALLFCALAFPAGAQTDFTDLTRDERAAFAEEMRTFLMAEPDVAAAALAPPDYAAQAYRDAADADRALIDRLSAQVLDGRDVALFISDDCPSCEVALEELKAISITSGANFMLHDMSNPESAKLATQLGMQDVPFYVLPDMILRGQMPQIVLTKYLTR